VRDLAAELNASGMLPTWKPTEAGATLVGTLAAYREQETKYGPAKLALIDPEDGSARQQVFLTPTVLKAAWAEKNPQVGDRVAIRFNGKHPVKGYLLFALAVERAAASPKPTGLIPANESQPYADAVVTGATSGGGDPFGDPKSRTI
jgi:hypothetical protein